MLINLSILIIFEQGRVNKVIPWTGRCFILKVVLAKWYDDSCPELGISVQATAKCLSLANATPLLSSQAVAERVLSKWLDNVVTAVLD